MGKASKWIINFLVGKQEKKINETNFSVSNSNDHHPSAAATKPAGTPKVKRRWSFGKLAGKEASQRFSKCVDSIDTEKLDLKTQQNHALALAKITRDIENASATRIQSAFRSHLARKALHALKGLVKLQALIRGHIVRKETAATIMRMQALMAIQVRARYKRIQMAEEAQQANKKQMNIQRKTINLNPDDRRLSESTSGHLNHSYRNTTFYSDHHLSNSKQHPFEESFFLIANSPSNSSVASSKPKPARSSTQEYVDPACHDYTFKPNYMSNTKSSKAKVRSHSEPKQRPESNMKHKTKYTKPVDETLAPMEDHVLKRSSSRFIPNGHKNHDPRFVKLYRSKRLFEDNKHASVSHTNYNESLAAAYELIDRQF